MKNTCQFYIVFEVLKVLLLKSPFVSCCFISHFTSADIISHNFLNFIQHYLKKDFRLNFPFLTDSSKFLTPLRPKSSKRDETFLSIFPKIFVRHNCQILLLPRIIRKADKKRFSCSLLLTFAAKFY